MLKTFIEFFAYRTTGDVVDGTIFGRDIGTWLIYALIFFGFSSLAFIWVWAIDFFRDRKEGKPLEKPWD